MPVTDFPEARAVFVRNFKCEEDGSIFSAYKANVACYLHDNHKMDWPEANRAAVGLMRFLFQEKSGK